MRDMLLRRDLHLSSNDAQYFVSAITCVREPPTRPICQAWDLGKRKLSRFPPRQQTNSPGSDRLRRRAVLTERVNNARCNSNSILARITLRTDFRNIPNSILPLAFQLQRPPTPRTHKMSARKRPLAEIADSSVPATARKGNPTTTTRYAPSTPHAIRALQVRSGLKTRSALRSMRHRAFGDVMNTNSKLKNNDNSNATEASRVSSGDSVVRPDSARGILRRLAKLTAPTSKRVVATPLVGRTRAGWDNDNDDKENARSEFDDDGVRIKRPRLTLDIEDSLEEEDEDSLPPFPDVGDEEEDSELPVAPTPSVLPDDGDEYGNGDPTITFKSIDFARQSRRSIQGDDAARRASRLSFPASLPLHDPHDSEDDPTVLSEYGRRAISEDPTGRLSRYSFGSIRMDDFGSELEIRRESDQQQGKAKAMDLMDDYVGIGVDDQDDMPLNYGEETERLQNLQRSPTLLQADESTINIPALDESFQLEIPDQEAVALHAKPDATIRLSLDDSAVEAQEPMMDEGGPDVARSPHEDQPADEMAPVRTSAPHRKRVKETRHGTFVPSLPSSLIKRVAIEAQARLGNRRPQLGRDHMKALEQATEWFFEQVGEDLEAYSDHARRKKRVDRSDALMLLRRQGVLKGKGELIKAAKAILPKEAVAELDLPDEL